MTNSKMSDFSTKKRKINNRDSKNQKIGINTNRRNIRESK